MQNFLLITREVKKLNAREDCGSGLRTVRNVCQTKVAWVQSTGRNAALRQVYQIQLGWWHTAQSWGPPSNAAFYTNGTLWSWAVPNLWGHVKWSWQSPELYLVLNSNTIAELSWVIHFPPTFDVSMVRSLWVISTSVFKLVLDKNFLRENGKKTWLGIVFVSL